MSGYLRLQSRTDLRPLTPDLSSGRVRLSILLALCALLFVLTALPFISHAASNRINSLSPWERAGVRVRSIAGERKEKEFSSLLAVRSMSLSWVSDRAWMNAPADANSTDFRPLISDLWSSAIFASRTARTLSPAPFAAALLSWNTFGNAGTETTEPSASNDPNLSAVNLTFGAGVTPAANANRFGGNAWFDTGDTNPTTLAESIAGNDYIQFIVTPNAGFSFTPTSLVFSWDRSPTGPGNVALRSSADNFATDLGTASLAASQTTGNTITISGLTNLTTTTTFRLYGYGGTSTAGTGGFDTASSVDNVVLNGTTSILNTISGTLFDSSGAAITSGRTLKLIQNGVVSGTTATTDGSGNFSFALTLSNNDVIGVFIDNASEKAETITKIGSPAANITGFDLRDKRVTLRNDDGGTTIANSDLATADSTKDADIPFTAAGDLTINNDVELFVNSGCSFAPGSNINAGGSWTNNGAIGPLGGLVVTFNSTANASIGGGTQTLFDTLTINKSSSSSAVSLSQNVDINSALNVTTGVFDLNGKNLVRSGTVTIAANGTLQDLGASGTITMSGSLSNSGAVNINAHGGSCGENDDIVITSQGHTQRTWSGTGTFNLTDVNVQDQGGTTIITVHSGTNSGNNGVNWVFVTTCTGNNYVWTPNNVACPAALNNDWTCAGNWNPTRATTDPGDVIIFDGNVTSGPTVLNVPTQTIASLRLRNTGPDPSLGVSVTLNAGTTPPGTKTLTISGATGSDLLVPTGSVLNLSGSTGLQLSLTSGSTGSVGGQIAFFGGPHQLLTSGGSTVDFTGPNAFTSDSTYSATTHPFGDGTGSNNNSIIFESGSKYDHGNGLSPFGTAANSVAMFKTGSEARYLTGTGFDANGRTYANLTIGDSSSEVVVSDSGSGNFTFDSLTVNNVNSPGTYPKLAFTGSGTSQVTIKGNITSTGGTLDAVDVRLAGGTNGVVIDKPNGTISFTDSNGNSRGIEFDSDARVTSTTTLSLARKVVMGSLLAPPVKVLSVPAAATLSGGSTGYVIGMLLKNFDASHQTQTFQVGDVAKYSPIVVSNASGTGSLTINARTPKHPSISGTNALARYWHIANVGLSSADLAFHYPGSDVTGNESNYKFFRYNGGFTQFNPSAPIDTTNANDHIATLTGVTQFSDWTLAEPSAVPSLAINSTSSQAEGNTGQANMPFTVNLSPASTQTVTVNYSTADGSINPATGGATCGGSIDYVTTTGTLTFAPSDTVKTINVPICGDKKVEPDETFTVTLDTPTNALITSGTSTGTITNDDHAPVANDVTDSTTENTLKTITMSSSDADGDAQTFSIVGSPSHGSLSNFGAPSCTSGNCTETVDYTPTSGYTGTDSFTYKTNDGANDSNTATVSLTISFPATLVVTKTADTNGTCIPGDCSLREAINAANSDTGNPHTINFDIPAADTQHFYYKDDGVANQVTYDPAHVLVTTAADDASLPSDKDPDWPHSWWSIRPTSALPAITNTVTIDGYTQPGASANTSDTTDDAVIRIELNGVNAGGSVHGLTANALSIFRGLTVNRFTGHGIALLSGSSSDFFSFSIVSGNFIGTDVSGTLVAANGLSGVYITNSGFQQIGCTVSEERNIISGNTGEGVELLGSPGNFVQGNFIGVAANGTSLLGNGGHGVEVYASASNNTIGVASLGFDKIRPEGGSGSGCQRSNKVPAGSNPNLNPNTNAATGVAPTQSLSGANIIAGNTGDGVRISSPSDINNLISQNSIYSNGRLGINLVGGANEDANGVTPNDPGDVDTGPNNLQNFPSITGAAAGSAHVLGTLSSYSSGTFTIEIFVNTGCDPSGNGEGQTFVGSAQAVEETGTPGQYTFDVTLASPIQEGQVYTATATDGSGNTSEFSPCFFTGFTISGHVGYCITPTKNVPNVSMNVTGSQTTSTTTDPSGNYSLTLPQGGSYTLTPSKTALSPHAAGIDTADVLGVQRHYLHIALLSGCAATAADANGDSSIDTVDVLAIQRFYLGLSTGTGNVGQWRFSPSSSSYPSLAGSQSAQNYDAIVIGDITGDLTPTRAHPEGNSPAVAANVPGQSANIYVPSTVATVSLPVGNISTSVTNFTLPVTTSNVNSADNLQAFQGDFTFDSTIVNFQATPASGAGLTASNWNVAANVSGAGTVKTLTISANSTNNTSLSGSGTLFNLNFTRVSSTPGQSTSLVWSSSPNNFVFIDTSLNKQAPGSTPPGSITIAGPTATQGDVSGRIVDSNGSPVEGAGVRLSGTQSRLTVTDAQGNYRFDNVDTNGFYTVTPARANFVFSPAQRSFSQLGQHTDAAFNAATTGESLNPLDRSEYFVRQQYLDFLNREPDEAGLNFWFNNIEACGADAQCREARRVDTSAAFFLSIEFQQTGYLVYRTYAAAYGVLPNAPVPIKLDEFKPDTQAIGNGVVVNQTGWQQQLENNKQAYLTEFVQRARFAAAYPTTTTPADFVDKLFANAGVTPSNTERDGAINEFGSATTTTDAAARARALRRVAENTTLAQKEFDPAFVLMQYFGYLRRDPNSGADRDFSGYDFWLTKLNTFNGSYQNAEMVKAFLVSSEYRERFPR